MKYLIAHRMYYSGLLTPGKIARVVYVLLYLTDERLSGVRIPYLRVSVGDLDRSIRALARAGDDRHDFAALLGSHLHRSTSTE